jgi:hypothetical protein
LGGRPQPVSEALGLLQTGLGVLAFSGYLVKLIQHHLPQGPFQLGHVGVAAISVGPVQPVGELGRRRAALGDDVQPQPAARPRRPVARDLGGPVWAPIQQPSGQGTSCQVGSQEAHRLAWKQEAATIQQGYFGAETWRIEGFVFFDPRSSPLAGLGL